MNHLKTSAPAITSSVHKAQIRNHISIKEVLVAFGMLSLLCSIVFHKFLLGFSVYLFKDVGSDTLNAHYPSFINIATTLWEGNIPGWSFEQGLGQNTFPFSLSEPTNYLLYVLGSDHLAFGIIWVEVIKIICSGILFFLFLRKQDLDRNVAYIGGLLYAFSGFMIVGGGWYGPSTQGLYTALLLLSFEMLYIEKKWWLFPISVTLIAAYNPVNLYTCSLFLFLYVLFRVLSDDRESFRKLPPLFMSLLLLFGLGVLMSSVFSMPNLYQMINSPRVSGEASHTSALASIPVFQAGDMNYLVSMLMRTFSSDMIGNGSEYKGWKDYMGAPLSYCGLISLLLVPQVFASLKTRKKLVYGTFIGIFIFASIFSWFRRAFWLFQGDYFRVFSLYTSIIFILFSTLSLDKISRGQKVNLWILGVSFITLLLLLYFPYDLHFQDSHGQPMLLQAAIDNRIQTQVALFLAIISGLLVLFSFNRYSKFVPIALLAITFVELADFSYISVNKRNVITAAEMHGKTGYNDYSNEALEFIKKQDQGFFRIEKNFGSSPAIHPSMNDSKVQHYFGSSSYTSFNQLNYINFLATCDVLNPRKEDQTRWAIGVKTLPILQVLTGVRYLIVKGEAGGKLNPIYENIGRFSDVTVLKSKYALPLGIAYDSYILRSDFSKLDAFKKQIALLKAIMIPDGLASDLSSMTRITENDLQAGSYSINELAMDTDKLKAGSFHIRNFSNNSLDGEIKTRIKQLVFLSIPFDKGWEAKVNGKDAAIIMVDGGLSAILVESGNNAISLRYFPPFVKTGLYFTLLGLLIFGMLVFNEKFRRSNLRLNF